MISCIANTVGGNYMELDSKLYLHDSDKTAMKALKAIPGFTQVVKAFMKVWDEKQFKLINMSTNLRLGPNQMPKYYNMLPPICEKLGIDVPELYVKRGVEPNAYTYGDTKPFIVLTSGLFETMPDELIPTIIAHECGHIACHHALYTTMGQALLNGAATFVSGLGNIALYPIQLAFAYWMRCSEFSADRAAIIYDESSEKMSEVCMRLAGYDKDIMDGANLDLFIEQANEYKSLVDESAWNKTMEFVMFKDMSHPLNAVRAYEGREWEQSERYKNIMAYINSPKDIASLKLPVLLNPKKYCGKKANEINTKLEELGFSSITMIRTTEIVNKEKDGQIVSVSINGETELEEDYYARDVDIVITYFENKTDEEIALDHPREILVEDVKNFIGKPCEEVFEQFRKMGFLNIIKKETPLPKLGKKGKDGNVAKIIIDGNENINKKSWFKSAVIVVIYYYASSEV